MIPISDQEFADRVNAALLPQVLKAKADRESQAEIALDGARFDRAYMVMQLATAEVAVRNAMEILIQARGRHAYVDLKLSAFVDQLELHVREYHALALRVASPTGPTSGVLS